jgi:hypothetical protein
VVEHAAIHLQHVHFVELHRHASRTAVATDGGAQVLAVGHADG